MKTTATLFSFRGRVTLNGQLRRAVLQIVGPPQRNGRGWFCWVRAEPLLQGWMKIYGIDPDQAQQLSAHFMLQIVDGAALCDDDGCAADVAHNLPKRSQEDVR